MFEIAGLDPTPVLSFGEARAPIHPEDIPEFTEVLKRCIASRQPVMLEHRWIRPDGELRHVHVDMSPEYDEAGACIHLLGTAQDITERKLADEALKRRSSWLTQSSRSPRALFCSIAMIGTCWTTQNTARCIPAWFDTFAPGSTYEAMIQIVSSAVLGLLRRFGRVRASAGRMASCLRPSDGTAA